jgi:hypothetical protein
MTKTYREWAPDQAYLFPPSPRDWLPEDDLVYFLVLLSLRILFFARDFSSSPCELFNRSLSGCVDCGNLGAA